MLELVKLVKENYKSKQIGSEMLQSQNFDIDLIAEKKECLRR